LPFLLSLTREERKGLLKLGDKRERFIQQAIGYAKINIEDTQKEADFEAYSQILLFYNNIRLAVENDIPGIRAIYEDLQTQFPRRKKKLPPKEITNMGKVKLYRKSISVDKTCTSQLKTCILKVESCLKIQTTMM
jgi:hypothetical protein